MQNKVVTPNQIRANYLKNKGKNKSDSNILVEAIQEDLLTSSINDEISIHKKNNDWIVQLGIRVQQKTFYIGSIILKNFENETERAEIIPSNSLIKKMLDEKKAFQWISLNSLATESLPLQLDILVFLQQYQKTQASLAYGYKWNKTELKYLQELIEKPFKNTEKLEIDIQQIPLLNNLAHHWLNNGFGLPLFAVLALAVILTELSLLIHFDIAAEAIIISMGSTILALVIGGAMGILKCSFILDESREAQKAISNTEEFIRQYDSLSPSDKDILAKNDSNPQNPAPTEVESYQAFYRGFWRTNFQKNPNPAQASVQLEEKPSPSPTQTSNDK